ncbi:ATP-binding protein [Cystobacter fuscus]|uniref:ATP-binding protein n=1 Tax=Cystobacter fuscus TaxID=43 RepID=UPI0037BEC296
MATPESHAPVTSGVQAREPVAAWGSRWLRSGNRLGRRLLLYILLFSIAVSLLGTLVQLGTDYHREVRQLEERFTQIRSSYTQGIAESLWTLDETLLRTQLEGITTLPGIVLVEVDTELGTHYVAGGGVPREFSREFPLYHGSRLLGTLRVGANLAHTRAELHSRVLVILATEAGKTFLFGLFAFFLIQRLVTQHLATMAAYTRGLDTEHLETPLVLRRTGTHRVSRDELDEVSAAINEMRESLRKQLEERQRSEAASAFLARAGGVLVESLDLEKVLPRIASVCVGPLADWCVIDLKEDGVLRRVGGAHVDAAKAPLLDELQRRYPPGPDSRVPAAVAARTGTWVLESRVTQAAMRAQCVDDAHVQLVSELGLGSVLAVPLMSRGHALGAITLAAARPERYGPAELALAEELARRAAIAIDNARLYRQAEQALRLRETFLSVAGHELRTPLLPLQLRLQSLLRRGRSAASLEPEVLLGEIAVAEWQTRRLGLLVDQLLDVSHLIAGNALVLRRKRMDLCKLVEGVLEGVQRQISDSGSEVVRELCSPVEGEWDPRRLELVVMGLVQNALKFGEGRPIDVRVMEREGSVLLVVRDRGMGMSKSEQEHIFDRFSRGVPEQHFGGLGLGLYLTREVVRAHGGSISVESEPGEGTTFTVVLPLGDAPGSAA